MTVINRVDKGSGSVVLCLHGIGSSSASFAPQIEELSARRRVVAWDAPGYAGSPDPQAPLDLAAYAASVAAMVRDLGAGPVHLLGVSWGGVIACRVALDYPLLLRSLVLVASSPGAGMTAAAAARMRERAGDLAVSGPAEFAAERAPRLLSPSAPPSLVDSVCEVMRTSIRLPGYRYAAASMADNDLTGELGRISVPTLVLVGDQDGVTGPPASRILAAGIPDAVLVTVRGAGHLVNQERPHAVNAWITSYLDIIEHLYSDYRT